MSSARSSVESKKSRVYFASPLDNSTYPSDESKGQDNDIHITFEDMPTHDDPSFLNDPKEDFDPEDELLAKAEDLDPTLKPSTEPESWFAFGLRQLKSIPMLALALVAAAPSVINAFVAPTGAEPKDIVQASWWRSLSPMKLTHSLANAASSLGINTIMNRLFFPLSFQTFWLNIKGFRLQPMSNITYILFGIGGAIGASAVAYAAFHFFPGTFLGELLAGGAALLNFGVLVATRYVGTVSFLNRIKNYFDESITIQKEFVHQLDHLNPSHKEKVNLLYLASTEEVLRKLNKEAATEPSDVNEIIIELAEALEEYAKSNPDLLTDPSKFETFLNGFLTACDLSAAAIMLIIPGLTFMQKGVDGLGTLKGFISGGDLSDWNPWLQRGLGSIPGLSSGFLYSTSAYDLRSVFVDTAKHLYYHPKQIPAALLLFVGNVLAASSLENIAKGIVKRPNIAFVSSDSSPNALVQAFIWTNAAGGFATNGKSTFDKAFLTPPPLADKMKTFDGMLQHVRNHGAHPISENCAINLRSHSLFNKKPTTNTGQLPYDLRKLPSFSANN